MHRICLRFTKDQDEEIILRPNKRKRKGLCPFNVTFSCRLVCTNSDLEPDSRNITKILKKNNLNIETLNWEDLLHMDFDTGTTSGVLHVGL
jgi:hypothetical protein